MQVLFVDMDPMVREGLETLSILGVSRVSAWGQRDLVSW